jgi:very-short-patch-repair endonuclease
MLNAVAEQQCGLLSRGQLLSLGLPPEYGSNRVAARRWRTVLDGVYLTHTGRIGFRERCWAAVLHCGPGSALARATAAQLHGIDRAPSSTISVVVPHGRRVVAPPWIEVVRQRRPIAWGGQPARTPAEVTALDLCDLTDDVDRVVGLVTATARLQRGTAHLRRELGRRRGVRHRGVLRDLLAEHGLESVLENRFLRDVVRAHGLPRLVLQRLDTVEGRTIRSDAVAEEYGVRIELDGRIHESRTDDDVWRDDWVAVDSGHLTLRLRWRHVLGRPCRSAALVARALRRGGWTGTVRRCGPDCRAADPG